MTVRPVSGSSTRVSWFPMPATRYSTEDTNPSKQSSDTPDKSTLALPPVRMRQRQWDRDVCPLPSSCQLWFSSQTTFLLTVSLSKCNSLNRLLIHLFCLSLSQLQQECIQCVISRVSVLGVWFSLHHICAPPPTEAWKLEQATPYFILHCLSPLLYFFLQKWRV